MKSIHVLAAIILLLCSCNSTGKNNKSAGEVPGSKVEYHVVLPPSLSSRQAEFNLAVSYAVEQLGKFARQYGWDSLTREPFMDSVMIFDNKKEFDRTLLLLAGADTNMVLPESYCGALEKRTLTVMAPEYYAKVYPEGIEDHSFEKLMVHEMAHRLHIRILNGNEEAMGPIWFYEGFAIFAAGQFAKSAIQLTDAERTEIMNNPERGSYLKYGAVFRHYTKTHSIPEMLLRPNSLN